jgi:hypothetical protein
MPNIRMKDTTAHANYGSMREGEVYLVNDEDAAHLVSIGLASKTSARTSADREAELAQGDVEAPVPTPSIEQQAAEAGTKPGDQSTESSRNPQPLNPPPPGRAGR